MKQILTAIILLLTTQIFPQTGTITVKDIDNQENLSFAHIAFQNHHSGEKSHAITNIMGIANNIATTKSIIHISYTGYISKTDTIEANTSKIYFLEEDIFNLNQITITATKTEKTLKNSPVITQVITAKQIEQQGFQNVVEVLTQNIPLFEAQRHAYGATLNMQGLKPVNILILIDGERFAGEFRGNMDYSRLNTQDIERIEIVKGASSALYGSQAMGAVVNIITKKPKEKFFATASVQYTTSPKRDFKELNKKDSDFESKKNLDKLSLVQNYLLGFNIKKFSGKTTFVYKTKDAHQLKGNKYIEANYFELDTTTRKHVEMFPMNVNGFQDFTLSQSLAYKISKKFKISAKASYYTHDEYDFLFDKKRDLFNSYTLNAKANYTPNDNSNYSLSWHSDIYDKNHYYEKLDSSSLNYRHQFHNPKLSGTFALNQKQKLSAGLEFLHESLLADRFTLSEEMKEKSTSNASLYLQDDINFNEKWNSVIGLRADYHTSYGVHLSPKLSVMFKHKKFTFRTNLASGYRSPNLKELYMDWNMAGILIIRGTERLKPEINNFFSISSEYTQAKLNTFVSVYYNSFKNKIEGVFSDDFKVYQYQNTSSAELFGLDYHINYKPVKFLFAKLAYSFVYEKRPEGIRLSIPSPHSASLQVGYNLNLKKYKLSASINGKFISQKEVMGKDEIIFQGETVEALYKIKYPAYTMWDLNINQKMRKCLEINAGIRNILDYKPKAYSFNTPVSYGRHYYVGIKVHISNIINKLTTKS